jgi:ElaB/YqjD/DUF883 family membrane-anchored ribosome-binding protein
LSKNKELAEVRNLEEVVKSLRKDMDKRLEDLKVQVNVMQEKATKTVKERPLLALGIAFVAGLAVGVALSKAND